MNRVLSEYRISIQHGCRLGVLTLFALFITPARAVTIAEADFEGRPQFKIVTASATYYYDQLGGGFSRMIDRDGQDWISFRKDPLSEVPASAAAGFRGIPNLVFGRDNPDAGVGHAGHDKCESTLLGTDAIHTVSQSGQWAWTWRFTDANAIFTMDKADPDNHWWFLYEGTVAGAWSPHTHYWGTDAGGPRRNTPDNKNQLFEKWRWAYFGDDRTPRVLLLAQAEKDELPDTLWFMGSTRAGLESPDGMAVFGFGRGPGGKPQFQGAGRRFVIGFVEGVAKDAAHAPVALAADQWLQQASIPSAMPAAAPARLREYREYASSIDAKLRLFARFECAAPAGILLVNMHGWHGSVKQLHSDDVPDPLAKNYFVISPEMRGRGDATGQPDCNGRELQDVIDAIEFARHHYHDRIVSPEIVFLSGGSGGGGNVFALLGKFHDTFAAARAYYGISDYALWHAFDRKGEFRDELEGIGGKDPKGHAPWIGGSPETNPEAYRSRGGLTTVGNLLTPTLVFHGADDGRVPVLHARLWVGAAQGAGRGALVTYHEQIGVGDNRLHNANETKDQLAFRNRTADQFLRTHRTPPALPERGTFVVTGYLKTTRFEVILDSIDHVGRIDYDLAAERFEIRSATARRATLRVRIRPGGEWRQSEIDCRP